MAAASLAQWNNSNMHPSPSLCSPCDLLNSSLVTATANDDDDYSDDDSWDEVDSCESSHDEEEEDEKSHQTVDAEEKDTGGCNLMQQTGSNVVTMASSSCDGNGVYIILQVDSEDVEDDEYRFCSSGEAMEGDGRL